MSTYLHPTLHGQGTRYPTGTVPISVGYRITDLEVLYHIPGGVLYPHPTGTVTPTVWYTIPALDRGLPASVRDYPLR